MLPSSSVGNVSTTELKVPGSTHAVELFKFFFFRISFLKKPQYLRMTLVQSKDNNMSNFLLYIQTIFPQALKESLK